MNAKVAIIAPKHGFVTTKSGDQYPIDESLITATSVVYDAVYVAGGDSVKTLLLNVDALHFVAEAFKHCKPIATEGSGKEFLQRAIPGINLPAPGVRTNGNLEDFVKDIKHHRLWEREETLFVAA